MNTTIDLIWIISKLYKLSKIVSTLRVGVILRKRINLFVFAETAPFLHWKNHMQLFHQNLFIISLFHNNKRIIEHRTAACNENTLTFLYKSTKWRNFFIHYMNCFIKWEMIMRSHFVNLIISYHCNFIIIFPVDK